MLNNTLTETYTGDTFRHTATGFYGVVVEEFVPTFWSSDKVRLTLEHNGEKKEFRLTELEEVREAKSPVSLPPWVSDFPRP